ncbi:MAG: hypothetical protein KME46_25720 [Brasilonema angustatum HA4187-MV1]|jgi:hypothetical protein|nr:hypothetical protein [Brasilonema angustatum HA4187-MV1]
MTQDKSKKVETVKAQPIPTNKLPEKTYIGDVLIKTTVGKYKFQQKNVAAIELLLFEDKKIDPRDAIAGARAIGFLSACEWFISTCYDIEGEPVTTRKLNEIVLEVPHLLRLVQAVGRGSVLIDCHDGEELVEDSDDFTIKFPLPLVDGEELKYEKVVHVKRLPIGWRHTPQYLAAQSTKDWVKINVDIITQYFEIDGRKWTEEELRSPGVVDLRVFNVVMRRLGKYLSAG